jgi:rare lipoprotein A
MKRYAGAAIVAAALSACGTVPRQEARVERPPQTARKPAVRAPAPAPAPAAPARFPRGGGYYLDDGPGDTPPADLASVPEPVPQLEPLRRATMRPYVVMGQTFTPMTELAPYKARGVASWYGRRYHGKQTSSGEIYDMYAISAAHPTLPIPSYARVTNVATGLSVVVRINDRGPFLDSRLIDLSYTAAHRIGVLGGGSALVEVESIIPDASGPATAYASARPAPRKPAVPAPAVQEPAPVAVAAAASGSEIDPILAIAAAARDVDPSVNPEPESLQIAAAAMQPAPRPSAGAAREAGGVYLQLGAFGSRENAESYLTRARTQIEWLGQLLHLVPRDDGIYRVHAGPYPSSWEARQAADRIASAIGIKPVVVTR